MTPKVISAPQRSSDPGHRIALLSEIFPPQNGGSGRWFWEMYRRLPAEAVRVLTQSHVNASDLDDSVTLEIQRDDLHVSQSGTLYPRGAINYWRLTQLVRRMYRHNSFDILHCGRCITEGWVGLLHKKIYGTHYLCFAHGEDVNLENASEGGVMSSRQHRWMGKRVMRDATLLIANSHNTRRILEDQWHVPPEKIRVIHPGVDIEQFKPAPLDVNLQHELGWQDNEVILTVGRLQKRKGHDQLIRALPQILKKVPSALYVIIGGGEEQVALQALVKDLRLTESVQFLGETSDGQLLTAYQQCDLFALPNRQIGSDVEGFGMVLVEAQACGKPVLAGSSGGTRETMQVDETGMLVDCDSIDDLARAVTCLLTDKAKLARMGRSATRWVESQFGWDSVCQHATSVFKEAYELSHNER